MKSLTKGAIIAGSLAGLGGLAFFIGKKLSAATMNQVLAPDDTTNEGSNSTSGSDSSGSTSGSDGGNVPSALDQIVPIDYQGEEDELMSSTGEQAQQQSQALNDARNRLYGNTPTNPQTPEERIALYRREQALLGDSAPGGVGHYAYMQYEYLIAKAQAEIDARDNSQSGSGSGSSGGGGTESAKALAIAKAQSDIAYWQNIIYEVSLNWHNLYDDMKSANPVWYANTWAAFEAGTLATYKANLAQAEAALAAAQSM